MAKEKEATKAKGVLLLKEVRLAFPDVFEAVEYEVGDGKPRYNATFLIEPDSENDKNVRALISEMAAEKFGKRAEKLLAAWEGNSQKHCYIEGDLKEYDGFEGMMALSAHRKKNSGPPRVLDRDRSDILPESGKIYGGCYVNAMVSIYAQGAPNDGMRCSFSGLQFVKDGDAFGGGAPAKPEDFEDLGVPEGSEEDLV